jgi:hypothetical protein
VDCLRDNHPDAGDPFHVRPFDSQTIVHNDAKPTAAVHAAVEELVAEGLVETREDTVVLTAKGNAAMSSPAPRTQLEHPPLSQTYQAVGDVPRGRAPGPVLSALPGTPSPRAVGHGFPVSRSRAGQSGEAGWLINGDALTR